MTANALDDAGEIVGAAAFANRPFDAYLWRNGRATDLGVLAGDCISQAFAINSKGQIVGNSLSCDGSTLRLFLWEKGSMVDLNTLIPSNSGLQLVETFAINDRGEIAGNGVPRGCIGGLFGTCQHGFVLIPCGEGDEGCEDNAENATTLTPDSAAPASQRPSSATPAKPGFGVREMLDRLRARRFPGLRTLGPGTGPTN